MQTVVSATLIALAASYLLTAWIHGSIFDGVRNYLEGRGLAFWACGGTITKENQRSLPARLADRVTELLLCPFCLSPHLCFWLHVLAWLCGVDGALAGLIIGPAASSAIVVVLYPYLRNSFFPPDELLD